jgi:superoxide reductase
MQKHFIKENARNTKMTKLNEVYKCNVCGNIVEMVHASTGTLVCCGQPMELLKEKTLKDEGKEKHVPVVEIKKDKIVVKIGSIPHPMEEKHYIELIEIIADGVSYKKFLKPGQKPEAEFCINASKITARDYCNVHGLWKN